MYKRKYERQNRESQGPKQAIYTQSGQFAGTVSPDRNGILYLFRSIDKTKHALRTPPGLAVDKSVLDQAEAAGAAYVLMKDRNTGETWRAAIGVIREKGMTVNRGFGLQIGLPFAYWQGSGFLKVEELPAPVIAPKVRQLDLFGELPEAA